MSDPMKRDEIETQIRELLETESSYWVLSEKLFGPSGLFGQLGVTADERRVIGRTPLFKEAQKRIRDMEYEIAERLQKEIKERPVRVERGTQTPERTSLPLLS